MQKLRLWRFLAALIVTVSVVCQGTLVLAGTTGVVSGTVVNATTSKPVSGIVVTASSPSQTATATTDSAGRFNFLALAPDSYTLTVDNPTYNVSTVSGVTVIADQSQSVSISVSPHTATIGRTTVRANSSLVQNGQTADVYSINPVVAEKAASVGGGGTQNSAFSALATVPGVFVNPNQAGYIGAGATLSIRGGDYNQIGYEIDGIPLNRAYDSYPSGPSSSLGQQELQVYTGAAPANADATGLSGFINQVIKTGTSTPYVNLKFGIGTPTLYNQGSAEAGGIYGKLSYYVGYNEYQQGYRIADQFNGIGLTNPWGQGLNYAGTPQQGYINGPYNLFNQSSVHDQDFVANLHYSITRKDGLKDDFQLLGLSSWIKTTFYDSPNDQGGAAYLGSIGLGSSWTDTSVYGGPIGVALPANYASGVTPYFFPHSPPHAPGDPIPGNLEDRQDNQQGIFKAQFTHPFSENLLFKVLGYTYYGDWYDWGPNSENINFFGIPADYEVVNHTSGVAGSLTYQTGPQLISFTGGYNSTPTYRVNNGTPSNGGEVIATRVDTANPYAGYCYNTGGVAVNCNSAAAGGSATLNTIANGALPAAGTACPSGSCTWYIMDNGYRGGYNHPTQNNLYGSLTDQVKFGALTANVGVRFDEYQFLLANTAAEDPLARQFWYNVWNNTECVNPASGQYVAKPTGKIMMSCQSLGLSYVPVTNLNQAQTVTYNEWQPRFALTYSLNPTTIIRASYGRYSQAPNAAYQQYDSLEANLPKRDYGTYQFQVYGFTTPNHPVGPQTSNNLDVSFEQAYPNQGLALKLTPFLRKTQNQTQTFFLNQPTNFVSGLNAGNQTSQGVEFEVDAGNFVRDGFSGKLAFTYTNSYITYGVLPNNTTVITNLNGAILQYNAYTQYCSTNPHDSKCAGTTASGAAGAACYTTAGVPAPSCPAGSIANPYWLAPVQGLLDEGGRYPTYDVFPGATPGGGGYDSYGAPYSATLLVQYKKSKFAVTPALQFYAGTKYGAPISTDGIAPDLGCAALGTTTVGDPRYKYGAVGGSPYDATTCTSFGANGYGGIPNVNTGTFDTIGGYTNPDVLQLNLNMTYQLTPKIQLSATLANLYNGCFGGSNTAWNVKGACGYGIIQDGGGGSIGNNYNPGTPIAPGVAGTYQPYFSGPFATPAFPFSAYFSVKIQL